MDQLWIILGRQTASPRTYVFFWIMLVYLKKEADAEEDDRLNRDLTQIVSTK